MSKEFGLSTPDHPDQKELYELEKQHLDLLKRNGILPEADGSWNIGSWNQQKNEVLSPSKPAVEVLLVSEALINTADEVFHDPFPMPVAAPRKKSRKKS